MIYEPVFTLLLIVVLLGLLQLACAYLILLERKMAAWVQDRLGPNRVGPKGLFQPVADGLKFLLKEQVVPGHVDKPAYFVAPAIAVVATTLGFAVVPFAPVAPGEERGLRFIIAPNLDIGILFFVAAGSLAVYAVLLAGWSSNNKYSFLGAIRSSAQLVSYEIPLGLAILGVVFAAGSFSISDMVVQQVRQGWNVLYQPIGFVVFLLSGLAECNRLPFDLPEAEQELVGGYHTEYSGLKFAFFFLGEYTHVISISFLCSLLYLGGWHLPGIGSAVLSGWGEWFLASLILWMKVTLFVLVIMLVRWTLPRFRYDQLMDMAWLGLMPLGLANIVILAVVAYGEVQPGWSGLVSVVFLASVGVGRALWFHLQPEESIRVLTQNDGVKTDVQGNGSSHAHSAV